MIVMEAWTAVEEKHQQGRGIIENLDNLKMLIAHLPVGVAIVRQTDGEIVYANQEAADILRLPQEYVTRPVLDSLVRVIFLDGTPVSHEELATSQARRTGQEARANVGLEYADGSVCWVAVRATPMCLPDGRDVVITSFTPITEIIAAQRQLEENGRLQEQFIANVSHELRTPLGIIFGYSELAHLDMIEAEKMPAAWKQVYLSAQRMRWLVENVLGVAKIESGNVPRDLFDLTAVVREMVTGIRILPLTISTAVTIDMEDETPLIVNGSEPLIALAVANLLNNAVKFSPGGKVTVRLEEDDTAVSVAVSDTGIGMSKATQAIIFERFRQGDGSDTRKFGGTGIGLYFVKLVADLHNGRIDVDSAPGEGSTFWLRLPRNE